MFSFFALFKNRAHFLFRCLHEKLLISDLSCRFEFESSCSSETLSLKGWEGVGSRTSSQAKLLCPAVFLSFSSNPYGSSACPKAVPPYLKASQACVVSATCVSKNVSSEPFRPLSSFGKKHRNASFFSAVSSRASPIRFLCSLRVVLECVCPWPFWLKHTPGNNSFAVRSKISFSFGFQLSSFGAFMYTVCRHLRAASIQ